MSQGTSFQLYGVETPSTMSLQQDAYPDRNHLFTCDHVRRALVIDYIMQVSGSLMYGRDTCYIAVAILDKYTRLTPNRIFGSSSHTQLYILAVVCVILAGKFNEDHCAYSNDIFPNQDRTNLNELEVQVLVAIGYSIPSLTIYTMMIELLNHLMVDHPTLAADQSGCPMRFEKACLLLDFASMDHGLFPFKPQVIVSSILQIVYALDGQDADSLALVHRSMAAQLQNDFYDTSICVKYIMPYMQHSDIHKLLPSRAKDLNSGPAIHLSVTSAHLPYVQRFHPAGLLPIVERISTQRCIDREAEQLVVTGENYWGTSVAGILGSDGMVEAVPVCG